MKRLLTLIFIGTLIQATYGQDYLTTTYMENTGIGHKVGFRVGKQFRLNYLNQTPVKRANIGGFYHHEVANVPREVALSAENEFFGLYGDVTMVQKYDFTVLFNVRMGVQNRQNFLITPSVKLAYSLSPRIEIESGLGVRGLLNPTYITGLTIRL